MENIKESVLNILAKFDIRDINSFKDEINSITFIEMVVKIEATFDITVEDEYLLIEKFGSLDDICNYIERTIVKA